MSTIYELNNEYLDLLELFEDPDADAAEIEERLSSIEDSFESKIESYCKVRVELDSKEEAIDKEIERLKKRKDAISNNSERVKFIIRDSMITLNKNKLDLGSFKLSIRENAPSVKIDDESSIPSEFITVKTSTSVDKKALGTFLKNCQENNEYCDFAHLERTKSLIIK